MKQPLASMAKELTGEEWLLLIQSGKWSRAQIDEVIRYARKNYKTDNLPEGTTNLFFTDKRAQDALSLSLSQKVDKDALAALVQNISNTFLTKADKSVVDQKADQSAVNLKADKSVVAEKADKTELFLPNTPTKRTINFGVGYQATNKARSAFISFEVETSYTVTLVGTLSDVVELRIGPERAPLLDGSGGHVISTFRTSLTGIQLTIGLSLSQRNQLVALVPPNWYFCLRRVSGTTAVIQNAIDQSL